MFTYICVYVYMCMYIYIGVNPFLSFFETGEYGAQLRALVRPRDGQLDSVLYVSSFCTGIHRGDGQ